MMPVFGTQTRRVTKRRNRRVCAGLNCRQARNDAGRHVNLLDNKAHNGPLMTPVTSCGIRGR